MRCRLVRDRLNAFIDRELRSPLMEEISDHLQRCPSCGRAYARLQRLASLFDDNDIPPVPIGFAHRALERARQELIAPHKAAREGWFLRRWRSVPISMRIAAAVVVAVGLSAGAVMGRFVGQTTDAQPATDIAVSSDPAAVYNLDYLAGTQEGSITQAYLVLVSARNESGE